MADDFQRISAVEPQPIPPDLGERLVRSFYDAWNTGGWQAVEPMIAEDFDDHASPPEWRYGRAGFRAARQASAQVVRDVQIHITKVFSWTQPDAQGQHRVFALTFVDIDATFAGPQALRGLPPTGGPITIPACSVFRFAERAGPGLPAGREDPTMFETVFELVEHWELQNLHAVWLTLGGPAQAWRALPTS